jgi:hypothetical protein
VFQKQVGIALALPLNESRCNLLVPATGRKWIFDPVMGIALSSPTWRYATTPFPKQM